MVRTYGHLALLLGLFLCWYAVWTIVCTVLVLTGVRYGALLWAPVLPTFITAAAGLRYGRTIIDRYAIVAVREPLRPTPNLTPFAWGMVTVAFGVALITAQLSQQFDSVGAVVGGAFLTAAILYRSATNVASKPFAPELPTFGWRLLALLLILYGIYLFGHRPDGDDANYVNLAIGAKRTFGDVFQFDTMIGDGPNPIHLPTYKFHSFELLGAVLSTYIGIEPIYVFHFVIPLLLIPLMVAILAVLFGPTAGPRWFAAALIWVAVLFFNLDSIGGWGLHGVVRFFQGKGFYVSGLLPLIVVLTVRWFQRGERSDLIALFLANVCAVGLSANGIYGGPAASVLAALPFVLTRFNDPTAWRRLLALAPTVVWPAIVVLCILKFGLAYPSEVMTTTTPTQGLNFVTWYGLSGRLIFALVLISGFGLAHAGIGKAAAFAYLPLFLLLTMNPLSWALILALTGNLGFRIFWSLPAPILLGLLGVALLNAVRLGSERWQIGAALVALAASVAIVTFNSIPSQKVFWHRTTLRVDQADWATTLQIAKSVQPACNILLPERYAVLLSMKEHAARPVAVCHLYMTHYRFTMPEHERALREQLLVLADGKARSSAIGADALRRNHIGIGAIAVDRNAPALPSVAALANALGLVDRGARGPLRLWASACYVPNTPATLANP